MTVDQCQAAISNVQAIGTALIVGLVVAAILLMVNVAIGESDDSP